MGNILGTVSGSQIFYVKVGYQEILLSNQESAKSGFQEPIVPVIPAVPSNQ